MIGVHLDREILIKDIYWPISDKISFNPENESFLDYLLKARQKFDHPRPLKQRMYAIMGIFAIIIALIYTILNAFDFSVRFFIEGVLVGPAELQNPFFSLLIVTSMYASILGQILVIGYLSFNYFLTKENWSTFHDQTTNLIKRLSTAGQIKDFVKFDETKKKPNFRLEKISVDFQIQWLFPFLFRGFPPLLLELLVLSFLLPFLLATFVSLFFALFNPDLFTMGVMFFLFILVSFGIGSNSLAIYRSWRRYNFIRTSMITKQQEIIHQLLLKHENELIILRNYENLRKLEKMHPFPLPGFIRVTALLPLLGSLLGYGIGLIILI